MNVRKIFKTGLLALCVAAGAYGRNFTVEGQGIRRIVTGQIRGTRVLFIAELDGSVSCYTQEGKKLWRNPTQAPAVMFDIAAADVDGDGRDDLVAASGDGHITCWNSNGSLRWRFNPGRKVRFNEVAVVKQGKKVSILGGGNDRTLYKLDENGKLKTKAEFEGAVRKIEVGDFLKKGKPTVFLMTMQHDKFNWKYFGLLDPDTLKEIKSLDSQRALPEQKSKILTDMDVTDLDGDGRDELLFFSIDKQKAFTLLALNGDFEKVSSFQISDKKLAKAVGQRYAHAVGASLLPVRDEILLQFGRCLFVLNDKGRVLHQDLEKNERFTLSDFVLDPKTKQLFGAGEVSGGNDVYAFDLTKKDWYTQNPELIGRTDEVNKNLQELYRQVLNFKMPAYQKPSKKPWMLVCPVEPADEVKGLKGNEVVYLEMESWSEDYDRSHIAEVIGRDYAARRDKRKPYTATRAELTARARRFEEAGRPFVIWAGHGNDPFYTHIGTLEAILDAAPNTCYGFVYAEMANPEDPRSRYFVDVIMPRLAKALRNNGKAKLYFRYKQTFWATEVQLEPWRRLFLSKKYADLLVPCTEDTNSITQELNLAGRVGMLLGGYVNDFGMRLIDDNVTGWRPLAPAMQKSFSPFLRSGVIRAAYGARFGLLYGFAEVEKPGMNLLYALMASGALPVADRDRIMSIGSWHLIDGINEELLHAGHDGHNIDVYSPKDVDKLIACSGTHWGGASVPEHDVSKLLGVDYRWLHFVPELPNGMVPIAPAEMAVELKQRQVPFTVSDVKFGIQGGKRIPAAQYGPVMRKAAETGAAKLPIRVEGASWSAIRLNGNHIRLVLIDPYYLDPRDCDAVIIFQGLEPQSAVDILSKEKLPMSGKTVKLTVPAGSLRFVDIAY